MSPEQLTRDELVWRYCETQVAEPEDVIRILDRLAVRRETTGFFLAECHMLGSSRLGSRVIIGYGPGWTFQTPPDAPFSPHGLASDMSVVIAICP